MSPDQVKALFDHNAVILMFLSGVAIKYWPKLGKVSNEYIGWINVGAYILTKLFVGDAHAGVADKVPDAVGVLLGGATNAGWAFMLYETIGRTFLEKILHLKKAVPAQ